MYDILAIHAILLFIHVILTDKYALFKKIFVILQRQTKI